MNQITHTFIFNLGDAVKQKTSGESATIRGRHDHAHNGNSYLVLVAGQLEAKWVDEDLIVAA